MRQVRYKINRRINRVNNSEFRKQIKLFIIFALGFTIAFSWRQTIFDASLSVMQKITNVKGVTTLSILASSFITVVSVALIYALSIILKDNHYSSN